MTSKNSNHGALFLYNWLFNQQTLLYFSNILVHVFFIAFKDLLIKYPKVFLSQPKFLKLYKKSFRLSWTMRSNLESSYMGFHQITSYRTSLSNSNFITIQLLAILSKMLKLTLIYHFLHVWVTKSSPK